MMTTLFDGFYQAGFVARDLDRALDTLRSRFALTRYRRRWSSPTMEALHAWVGGLMIEVIQITDNGPEIYRPYIPADPAAIRLHHHGYRVLTAERWDEVNRQVRSAGFETPMQGAVMNGQLNYLYADTRDLLGIYSEFVFLTGDAVSIYDDVPEN